MVIKRIIKFVIKSILKELDLDSLYCLRKSGYLKKVGWFRSYKEQLPVDISGNPIPWMTYPSINFLEKRINKGMTVFEYGCGNSTLWWANRVKQVFSYEHNKQWYDKMKFKIPSNVELYHIDLQYGGEYSRKVSEYVGRFDIVIIDGRDRINCAKNCLSSLKKEGVIIWDNSDKQCYEEGFNYLLQNHYKRIDFEGMGPVNSYPWSTSIFYKNENCLGI